MGYEDTFYRLKNVVGYTGNLTMRTGSLYFESPVENKYGRITVGHQTADNNGRGKVENFQNFVRQNKYHDNRDPMTGSWEPWLSDVPTRHHTELLHTEASDGEIIHISRGRFIPYLQVIPSAHRAIIFYIIDNNPNQKANGNY